MSRATARALRLVVLMAVLYDRRQTAADLAMRLGVRHRTINRDLLDLQGAPLYLPLTSEDDTWGYVDGARINSVVKAVISALGKGE